MEKLQKFQDDRLIIQIEESSYLIKIIWLGECSSRNPSLFLAPILEEQYKISHAQLKKIIFDFTKTQYMNSAGIIPIIKFLKKIGDDGGSIQVLYNRFERWQSVLIGELKIFETEDNRIQIMGVDR